MRWPWLNSTIRTLRFRLTLWNSFVVLVVGLTTLYAVRLGVRYTLVYEADATLSDELQVISLALKELYPDQPAVTEELQRMIAGHRDHNWFVELSDESDKVLFVSDNFPKDYGAIQIPLGMAVPDLGAAKIRVFERRVEVQDGIAYRIRLGSGLEFVEQDVNRLTRAMVPIFIVLIVAAPLGGFILARQATAPIRQIIETTQRLRPSQLRERLRIRGTGDELDNLSSTINHFLDVIAGYLMQHQEFVGNAAHELRSPLTAIRTNVEVALSRPRSREEYEQLLEQVADECSSLTRLVNQLLVLAENEAGTQATEKQPVSLVEITNNCMDMLSAVAEDKEIELVGEIDGEIQVLAEPNRLRQVVVNLIDNALKFTPEGGEVRVKLSVDNESKMAHLSVADSGCGIDPEDLPRLFERFYRAEKSHQRKPGASGSGLGLSICQLIVERYGGLIWVESPTRPDASGTTVHVKWPLAS